MSLPSEEADGATPSGLPGAGIWEIKFPQRSRALEPKKPAERPFGCQGAGVGWGHETERSHPGPLELGHLPWELGHLPWEFGELPGEFRDLPWAIRERPGAIRELPREVRERPWALRDLPWELAGFEREVAQLELEVRKVSAGREEVPHPVKPCLFRWQLMNL
jgi:hypothetical protein